MKRAFGMAPPLIAAGHKVTICLEDAPENRAAIDNIPGCRALFYRKGSWWQERREKRRQLRSGSFDFIHICGLCWRNALLPSLELVSPAIMEHTELESSLVATPVLRRARQWMLEMLSPLIYSNTVASSKYLERLFSRRMRRLGMKRNILYLPFASESAVTSLGEAHAIEFPSDPRPSRLILYMGSLYHAYGVFDLLNALKDLHKLRNDWTCVYAGGGPEKDELERQTDLAGLSGVVRFPGRLSQNELAAFLKGAAVFVSPLNDTVTDWARCPGKTFIYMMFEKPIVTCRIGENLNALGDDGFYYDPGDSGSMCLAINHALNVSGHWRPRYRKEDQTWEARACVYEQWLQLIQNR